MRAKARRSKDVLRQQCNDAGPMACALKDKPLYGNRDYVYSGIFRRTCHVISQNECLRIFTYSAHVLAPIVIHGSSI